jgi:hypothetical protein
MHRIRNGDMAGSELYEELKKAVGEIEEGGITAYGLSSAYMYALAKIPADSVSPQFRKELAEIRAAYAGADPSSEIDDSLAANSMLILDEEELQSLADRIVGLYHKVAGAEGLPIEDQG